MKKFIQIPFLVLMIFLSAYASFGQESKSNASGFWGMKFGSSPAECRKIILAKKNGVINEKLSSKDEIFVSNPEFASRKTQSIILRLKNNKLIGGNVFFKLHSDAEVFEEYDSIKKELNDKYYETEQDYKTYKPPSHHVDGLELMALKSGYLKISAFWTIKQDNSRDVGIGMLIDKNLYVFLSYWDETARVQERLNEKGDY